MRYPVLTPVGFALAATACSAHDGVEADPGAQTRAPRRDEGVAGPPRGVASEEKSSGAGRTDGAGGVERKPRSVFDGPPERGREVHTAAHIDEHNGEFVEVFGTYEQVAVGKAPESEPAGHAAVRLADGALVHISAPWTPQAVRSAEERAEHEGQQVVVTGILYARGMPAPGGGAYAMVPCVDGGVTVLKRSLHGMMRATEDVDVDAVFRDEPGVRRRGE